MRIISLPQRTITALARDNEKLLKEVAQRGQVSLSINEREVSIEGDGGQEWVVEQVLKALGCGFLAKQAFRLFSDQFFMEEISLQDAFRGNEKKIIRYKARVIGQGGIAKKKLEELSGAFIAVGADSIAILGEFDDIKSAKEAVLRLLEGCEHYGVYAYLEKENQRKKRFI